jgi:hypothetical protein
MSFETEQAKWIKWHLNRRTGERKDALKRGHGYGIACECQGQLPLPSGKDRTKYRMDLFRRQRNGRDRTGADDYPYGLECVAE